MRRDDPQARWQELMALLEPIHDRVRATARRLSRSLDEGDDLFQEALLRAFDRLPDLREPSRFRSWFYAVLLSVHRNRSRRAFWRRFFSLERETARGFAPAVDAVAPGREERRRADRVSRALASLPAVQKEAVVLFILEELSIEEIAAAQKVSVSAVKSRLQRGRDRLRRFYEREGLGAAAPSLAPSVQPRSFGEGSAP